MGVNISLKDSSSLSFLNSYAPSIRSFPKDSRTNFFSSCILFSYVEAEAVEFSRVCFCFRSHRKRSASTASASSFCFRLHIPNVHFPVDSHTVPHPAVYIVIFWIPATEHSNMSPLLMKPTALTNVPHHTLTTQIFRNKTSMLIHIKMTSNQSATIDWFGRLNRIIKVSNWY